MKRGLFRMPHQAGQTVSEAETHVISTILSCSNNGFGQPFLEFFFLPEPLFFGSGLYFGLYADFSLSDSISPAIRLAAFALAFLTACV